MRKHKSEIREYWELKKLLRLITLSVLVLVGGSLFLLSNSNLGFNDSFGWAFVPYFISYLIAFAFLNVKYTDIQATRINRFTLKFLRGKRFLRIVLINLAVMATLYLSFLSYTFLANLDKFDKFSNTVPFVMLLVIGTVMRPCIRVTEDSEWSEEYGFDPSHSSFPDPSYSDGMSDMYGTTSLLNPGNPASMLNSSHSLNPSNL